MLAGEFAEEAIVGVVGPLVRAVDCAGEGGAVELVAVVAGDGGRVAGGERFETKDEQEFAQEKLLEQVELEIVVAFDRVRLTHENDIGCSRMERHADERRPDGEEERSGLRGEGLVVGCVVFFVGAGAADFHA